MNKIFSIFILVLFLQSSNFSQTNSITFTLSEVDTSARTLYQLQSNGNIKYIWQDPSNNLHACFMVSKTATPFLDRIARYFYSTNMGINWSDYVVSSVRSGFPCITAFNSGRAVVLCHTTDGGGDVRCQLYIDSAPGAGRFTRLDPGNTKPPGGTQPIWPFGITLSNNQIAFVASGDTCFRNICTSISPPTFSGYVPIIDAGTSETYTISRTGNTIGIVYITGSLSAHPAGSVYIIQSSDNGNTWGQPQQIWLTNFSTDSLGAFRYIDINYQNGQPKVIFSLCKLSPTGFNPNSYSKVMFWSPNINSGTPVLIDSAGPVSGTSGGIIGKSVLGNSSDGNFLFAAWNKPRSDTSTLGAHYYDVYFAFSGNGGSTWKVKTKLTNNSGPLTDYGFVSISPTNYIAANGLNAYLILESDTLPGAVLGTSWAKMIFCNVLITPAGIKKIGDELPSRFFISQNYPNPFNPSTSIKFDIPNIAGQKMGVKLTVYDILGKVVAIPVNEELGPGKYDVNFDGNNLASGIYFYRIEAGNYVDSKKMILVK